MTSDEVHRLRLELSARRASTVECGYAWWNAYASTDFAWKCEKPVSIRFVARSYALPLGGVQPGGETMVAVPCRKCWPCQLQRRREWIARAVRETLAAKSTWLFTGTFRDPPERAAEVVERWKLYRARCWKAGARFRFVMVVESGELRGRLHCHALMHGDPAHYWKWRDAWTDGHSDLMGLPSQAEPDESKLGVRLDDDTFKQICYVAGYVTGDLQFPVRASQHYGKEPECRDTGLQEPLRRPSPLA